jgi:MYXO-CTERM domain-containing protein
MPRIRSIARAAALALGLTVAALGSTHAQTFSTQGGSATSLIGASGSFNPQWFGGAAAYESLFDLDNMLRGASLMLQGPATLSFTLVGFEASYNNLFLAGNQVLRNSIDGQSALGDSFSFKQTSSGAIDFGFLSNGKGWLWDNGSVVTGLMLSRDRSEALILFNDNYLGDRDFDDMVIRVSISPVPEPESALLWLAGLAGLGGWLRRHRKFARAKAS